MFAVFDDGKAFGDFACLLVVLDGIALFDFVGDDLLYKAWVDVLDTGFVGVGVDGYFCGYGRFANGEFEELACEGAESYAQHLCEAVPVERVAALGDVCDFSVNPGFFFSEAFDVRLLLDADVRLTIGVYSRCHFFIHFQIVAYFISENLATTILRFSFTSM